MDVPADLREVHAQRESLLEALLERPILQDAALKAGVSFRRVQLYLLWASEHDEAFYERFEDTYQLASTSATEDAIRQRAIYGVEDVVLHQGAVVYVEGPDGPEVLKKRVYSDSLLKDLARATMPDKYGDKVAVDLKGAGGAILLAPTPVDFNEMLKQARESQSAAKKPEASE